MRDLIDPADGENRAVRAFLMHYGAPGLTVQQMRNNMRSAGWDGCWPAWVPDAAGHLTKGGAQHWLRYLFALEHASGVAGNQNSCSKSSINSPDTQFAEEEARRGYAMRDGTKHYCCYGMYCDAGHSDECTYGSGVKGPEHG